MFVFGIAFFSFSKTCQAIISLVRRDDRMEMMILTISTCQRVPRDICANSSRVVYYYLYLSINRDPDFTRPDQDEDFSINYCFIIYHYSLRIFRFIAARLERDYVGSQHIGYVCNGIGAFNCSRQLSPQAIRDDRVRALRCPRLPFIQTNGIFMSARDSCDKLR